LSSCGMFSRKYARSKPTVPPVSPDTKPRNCRPGTISKKLGSDRYRDSGSAGRSESDARVYSEKTALRDLSRGPFGLGVFAAKSHSHFEETSPGRTLHLGGGQSQEEGSSCSIVVLFCRSFARACERISSSFPFRVGRSEFIVGNPLSQPRWTPRTSVALRCTPGVYTGPSPCPIINCPVSGQRILYPSG
jgi:hypothetical protein